MESELNQILEVPVEATLPLRTFLVRRPSGLGDVLVSAHDVSVDGDTVAFSSWATETINGQRVDVRFTRRIFKTWTDVEEQVGTSAFSTSTPPSIAH